MNMNQDPTAAQLGELLGEKNDGAEPHFLWVDQLGFVHVAPQSDTTALADDVRLQYAPFEAGVGLVGPDAAGDSELLDDLLASLTEQWTAARSAPPGVRHVDLDDPDAGADWEFSEVATVDDALLARLARAALH